MAAGNWIMFDSAKEYLLDGTIDFDTDTIKCALFASAAAFSVTSHTTYATTNELSTANGYTQGGVTVTTPAVDRSGSTTKLSAAAIPAWTASGGSIAARYALLYKSGTANSITNPVIGYCLLDTTPADVTVTAGNTLTISVPANGFFSFTGATS